MPLPRCQAGVSLHYKEFVEKYHKSLNTERFLQCGYLICKEFRQNKTFPNQKGITRMKTCGR
jgi:hypothetical protein